ncbi:hypothetical protein PoB_005258400 [Plakobranchus ocellatus]|uniref:Uncharacterized protein n=1 Tax=Plakobranchus ocellatus TaxID=259542 RepID=A0AAV4C4P4_9GAST|nr:hypothetical protein PoB_005258400 [Plakobranchus ocellatus]
MHCVAFATHISVELPGDSSALNLATSFRKRAATLSSTRTRQSYLPYGRSLLVFPICDRPGLHAFTPCLLSLQNCLGKIFYSHGFYRSLHQRLTAHTPLG